MLFRSAMEEFINREEEGVIFGYSSDAKDISLLNCYPSGGNLNFSCRFPIQRYRCQHLIIGTHIETLDNPLFFKTQIEIPYLSYGQHRIRLKLPRSLMKSKLKNIVFLLNQKDFILIL